MNEKLSCTRADLMANIDVGFFHTKYRLLFLSSHNLVKLRILQFLYDKPSASSFLAKTKNKKTKITTEEMYHLTKTLDADS